jgi:hypothetical protein
MYLYLLLTSLNSRRKTCARSVTHLLRRQGCRIQPSVRPARAVQRSSSVRLDADGARFCLQAEPECRSAIIPARRSGRSAQHLQSDGCNGVHISLHFSFFFRFDADGSVFLTEMVGFTYRGRNLKVNGHSSDQ